MEYLVLRDGDAYDVANKAAGLAVDGWRLMGPVLPVLHAAGSTTFMATMERTPEDLIAAVRLRQAEKDGL